MELPFYPEIRLAWRVPDRVIKEHLTPPVAVHIATEGPVGFYVRNFMKRHDLPFTTSYHTNFPEYLYRYARIPEFLVFSYLRMFHKPSRRIMVSTTSLYKKLKSKKFRNQISIWGRGVDTKLFYPRPKTERRKPIALYVGRVALEKNLLAFLRCPNDVEKWVVGTGPALADLKKNMSGERQKDVIFWGPLQGEELAQKYAQADVFVFPSRTDTFGIVMLEALASGLPVAAYPTDGPIDVVGNHPGAGFLHENLSYAIDEALDNGSAEICRNLAETYTWDKCTEQFVNNLQPF